MVKKESIKTEKTGFIKEGIASEVVLDLMESMEDTDYGITTNVLVPMYDTENEVAYRYKDIAELIKYFDIKLEDVTGMPSTNDDGETKELKGVYYVCEIKDQYWRD